MNGKYHKYKQKEENKILKLFFYWKKNQ